MLAALAPARTLLSGAKPFAHGKSLCHRLFHGRERWLAALANPLLPASPVSGAIARQGAITIVYGYPSTLTGGPAVFAVSAGLSRRD